MTASPWWEGLDDPALAALGSTGLLRRAKAARIGAVTTGGATTGGATTGWATAEVEVDGLTVTLGAKGIASARCPCPATGLCLHVLAAILALRSGDPASGADVAAEIAALSEAEVLAFAGSDLAAAVRLMQGAALPDPGDGATSLTLTLPGLPHPVTFLSGAGLRGAVWKGADGRRRLAVTAAALVVRGARGVALPTGPEPSDTAEGFDRTLLDTIGQEIEAAVGPVVLGYGGLAADRLLDLALSARIDAAPRLAGVLRDLVERAIGLENRVDGADAPAFLIAAARAQALAHVLAGPDPDPRLAGLLRRQYPPQPPLSVWMLGARRWQSASGARGLRLWGWDAQGRRWIATGAARPDGLDPSFDPQAAYRRPMLGLPSAAHALGQVLQIEAPLLSDDLRLSADCVARVQAGFGATLPEHTDWPVLRRQLWDELGPALLCDGQVRPAILAPAVCDAPVQTGSGVVLQMRDRGGRPLTVALEGLAAPALTALTRVPRGARFLVEAREIMGRLRFDLVSVLHEPKGALVWNPTLDPPPAWPEAGWLAQVRRWSGKGRLVEPSPPGRRLSEDLLLAALELGQGLPPDTKLADRIAVARLEAVDRLLSPPSTAANALRLAWIAADLRRTEPG